MVDLVIKNITISNNCYKISWDVSSEVYFLKKEDVVVKYSFELKQNYFLPLNAALSALLPIIVKRCRREKVKVISPYAFDELTKAYWQNYMREVIHTDDFELIFQGGNIDLKRDELFKSELCSVGLFFGGGVESMFALSTMYHTKPVLLSVVGKNWMNNDHGGGGI